jgi:hypothetical protein
MQIKNYLILIGTIWPVIGVVVAILVAFILTGWRRWLMLFIGPVLFLLPCYIYAEQIAYNGNMLFVALMALVWALAFIYYPILGITGMVLIIKEHEHKVDGSN